MLFNLFSVVFLSRYDSAKIEPNFRPGSANLVLLEEYDLKH